MAQSCMITLWLNETVNASHTIIFIIFIIVHNTDIIVRNVIILSFLKNDLDVPHQVQVLTKYFLDLQYCTSVLYYIVLYFCSIAFTILA